MNILIVAGNFAEFTNYKKKKLNQALMNDDAGLGMEIQAYRYVDNANVIRGMRDVSGVFIGSWRSRKDILEIVTSLRMLMTQPNPALQKIWDELCAKSTATQVMQATSSPAISQAAEDLKKQINEHLLKQVHNTIQRGGWDEIWRGQIDSIMDVDAQTYKNYWRNDYGS